MDKTSMRWKIGINNLQATSVPWKDVQYFYLFALFTRA